jgi:hypothetical protein
MAPEATAVSVGTRVAKGSKSTGRFIPKAFKYNLRIPTLRGVDPGVRRAFDERIDSLIAEELAYYSRGALTKARYTSVKSQEAGGSTMSDGKWMEWCHENFWDLGGTFTSAIYRGRYVSVVLTFSGLNAPCASLGGMWVAYQTDRAVTVDTKTGEFKSLADFTSNATGEVTAAVRAWHSSQADETLPKRPGLGKNLKVCDRPGNMATVFPQKSCYPVPTEKTGLVAWSVQASGIKLVFPSGSGPRSAVIGWARIPRLL